MSEKEKITEKEKLEYLLYIGIYLILIFSFLIGGDNFLRWIWLVILIEICYSLAILIFKRKIHFNKQFAIYDFEFMEGFVRTSRIYCEPFLIGFRKNPRLTLIDEKKDILNDFEVNLKKFNLLATHDWFNLELFEEYKLDQFKDAKFKRCILISPFGLYEKFDRNFDEPLYLEGFKVKGATLNGQLILLGWYKPDCPIFLVDYSSSMGIKYFD